MKKLFGVINSDSVNKKNMVFPASVLMDALDQRWFEGMPVNIGHDSHRPLGWGKPFGLYLEAGLTRLLGLTLLPESENEFNNISEIGTEYLKKRYYLALEQYIEELEITFKDFVVDDYKYIDTGCPAIINKGIVERMYPKLFEAMDKDELIPLEIILTYFDIIHPGYFKDKNTNNVIFCHEFFRKSLSRINNFNEEFLTRLFDFKDDKNLDIKIKIDCDMIGLYRDFKKPIELEYWHGPKFNDNIEDIDHGVAVHVSGEEDYERVFHEVSRTEFWLKKEESLRTFEIEELKNYYSYGLKETVYANRYIHAIYDIDKKEFNHFDGAIKIYDDEKMMERIDCNIKQAGKNATYVKLFRMDKRIALGIWKSLVADYFRGNPFIVEYFGGEKENLEERKILISPKQQTIVSTKCPYKIDSNNDIKVLLTYHYKPDDVEFTRKISPIDSLTIDNKLFSNVMQHDIIEVKKVLKSMDDDLTIPDDATLIAFEDLYINLPLIQHGSVNFPQNLKNTIKTYCIILDSLARHGSNHILSLCFSWFLNDREIIISLYGHNTNLKIWFDEIKNSLPIDGNDLHDWVQKNADFLKKTFSSGSSDIPYITDIVQTTGLIWFKRNLVENDYLYFPEKLETKPFELMIKLPPSETELIGAINSGELSSTCAYFVKATKCNICGEDYFKCPHSKFLDKESICIMSDVSLLFMYWTDKIA